MGQLQDMKEEGGGGGRIAGGGGSSRRRHGRKQKVSSGHDVSSSISAQWWWTLIFLTWLLQSTIVQFVWKTWNGFTAEQNLRLEKSLMFYTVNLGGHQNFLLLGEFHFIKPVVVIAAIVQTCWNFESKSMDNHSRVLSAGKKCCFFIKLTLLLCGNTA